VGRSPATTSVRCTVRQSDSRITSNQVKRLSEWQLIVWQSQQGGASRSHWPCIRYPLLRIDYLRPPVGSDEMSVQPQSHESPSCATSTPLSQAWDVARAMWLSPCLGHDTGSPILATALPIKKQVVEPFSTVPFELVRSPTRITPGIISPSVVRDLTSSNANVARQSRFINQSGNVPSVNLTCSPLTENLY
jgi:hypothetical protein